MKAYGEDSSSFFSISQSIVPQVSDGNRRFWGNNTIRLDDESVLRALAISAQEIPHTITCPEFGIHTPAVNTFCSHWLFNSYSAYIFGW